MQLITDNGYEFINNILREVNKVYGITHNAVTAYRPSANGLVESKNKLIVSILRVLAAESQNDWPGKLQIATTALNTAHNRALGDNSFFLAYAKDIRYPYDAFINEGRRPFYNINSYREWPMGIIHSKFKTCEVYAKKSP